MRDVKKTGWLWAVLLVEACTGPNPDYVDPDEPRFPQAPTLRRIFVTGVAFRGAEVGDALCQRGAQAGGLSGTFLAWVTTQKQTRVGAQARVADVGPWYDLRGRLLFQDRSEMAGPPRAPIEITEKNTVLNGGNVWTGTDINGGPAQDVCLDPFLVQIWKATDAQVLGVVGEIGSTTARWTHATRLPCDRSAHLVCVEQ